MVISTDSLVNLYMQVTVRVLDTNDNGPVFQSELYVFAIPENSTESPVVGSVLAEDRDEGTPYCYQNTCTVLYYVIVFFLGTNAMVSYVLLGVSPPGQASPFVIDGSSGVITKSFDLDREAVDQYELNVEVFVSN